MSSLYIMATIVGESGAKKEFLERINDLLKVYTVHKKYILFINWRI